MSTDSLKTKPKYKPNPLSKKYGHHAGNYHKKTATSINVLKQQLRSVRRMIAKFPERNDLVQSKRALEQRIEMAKASQKEEELKEKYKYLKFVESKKIKRRLEKETDEEKRRELELFLAYVTYYPADCKYVSIFGEESDKKTEIMQKIKELMNDGKLKEGFVWRLNNPITESIKEDLVEEKDEFFL